MRIEKSSSGWDLISENPAVGESVIFSSGSIAAVRDERERRMRIHENRLQATNVPEYRWIKKSRSQM